VHPTLIIGPLPLTSQTFFVSSHLVVRVIYLLLAPWLAVRLTAPLGIAKRDTLILFAIGIPAGVLGAHLVAVLETGGYLTRDLGRLDAWTGRSAIFGGLFAGVGTAAIYTAARGIPLARFLDGCAPVMALGEAMTRVGCFLAGCCFGKPTASFIGVTFPRGTAVFTDQSLNGLIHDPHAARSLPVHPTQLYAAVFAFALAGVLLYVLRRRPHSDGTVFALFLLSYALWRFVLAYVRADSGVPVLFGLYASQLWSLAAAVMALALAAYSRAAASRAPTQITSAATT
jgi:phosphatidylglycerol:prolipoprotein diacylglycerol transferase